MRRRSATPSADFRGSGCVTDIQNRFEPDESGVASPSCCHGHPTERPTTNKNVGHGQPTSKEVRVTSSPCFSRFFLKSPQVQVKSPKFQVRSRVASLILTVGLSLVTTPRDVCVAVMVHPGARPFFLILCVNKLMNKHNRTQVCRLRRKQSSTNRQVLEYQSASVLYCVCEGPQLNCMCTHRGRPPRPRPRPQGGRCFVDRLRGFRRHVKPTSRTVLHAVMAASKAALGSGLALLVRHQRTARTVK